MGQRIADYEIKLRKKESETLREWEANYFLPLVRRLENEQRLAVLSWEQTIEAISVADPACGDELMRFYQRCLNFSPPTNQRMS